MLDRKKTMDEADRYASGGQVAKALIEYRKLHKEYPDDLGFMNRIGDLCVQAGRLEDASAMFKLLAQKLHRNQEEKKAIAVLKRVLRLIPGDKDVANLLVEQLMASGAPKEAAQIHFQMAINLEKIGDAEGALEQFALGVSADPSNLNQRMALAQRCAEAGQKEKAAGLFLDAAEALVLARRDGEARTALGRAKTLTESPRLILTQARLELVTGNAAEAVRVLQSALDSHRGNPVLIEALAEAEIVAGEPEAGLRHLGELRQPTERCLPHCENALHDLFDSGKGRMGLRLFRPLARALAAKGSGAAVSATLKNAFKGWHHPGLWILLADVALEGDQQEEALASIRHAYTLALDRPSAILRNALHKRIEDLEGKKKTIGQIITEQAAQATMAVPMMGRRLDPKAKLQADQLEKEAHAQAQQGNHQGSISLFQQVLGMDPTRMTAIQGMVNVFIGSGQIPKALLQCTQSAQILALMGKKQEARQLFDIADHHAPGSTRGPRQMLGL
jgi:tetratricopeptide (TPR) repeat protein